MCQVTPCVYSSCSYLVYICCFNLKSFVSLSEVCSVVETEAKRVKPHKSYRSSKDLHELSIASVCVYCCRPTINVSRNGLKFMWDFKYPYHQPCTSPEDNS